MRGTLKDPKHHNTTKRIQPISQGKKTMNTAILRYTVVA